MNDMTTPPLLKIDQATVIRQDRRVLDDVSLEIRAGEHTAILGPNGAGKTALIRLITREDYPLAHDNGTPPLAIMGQSLWNVAELRTLLGIVSADLQAAFLWRTRPGTRGLTVVLSGFFASYGVFPHHRVTGGMRAKAAEALALLEASHLAGRVVTEMSNGEVRRLLIARALVSDPLGLMLDEPTTGLDLVARQRFLATLQRLARRGKTIILVTHHVDEIFPEIGQIVLLKAGRVLFAGEKREGLTSAHLSAMFGAPVKVEERQGYYTAAPDARARAMRRRRTSPLDISVTTRSARWEASMRARASSARARIAAVTRWCAKTP